LKEKQASVKANQKTHANALAESTPAAGPAIKLSVNVSTPVGERLRKIAFEERISESSVVEIALQLLFDRAPLMELGSFLRDRGATLRRGGR
jgi:thymidylate kinase